jgi:hypothetical protein
MPPPGTASRARPGPSGSPAAPLPIPRVRRGTFRGGQTIFLNLKGGDYRFSWKADGCTELTFGWMPSNDAGTKLDMSKTIDFPTALRTFTYGGVEMVAKSLALPEGDLVVTLPAGPGYLNSTSDCDFTVSIAVAP